MAFHGAMKKPLTLITMEGPLENFFCQNFSYQSVDMSMTNRYLISPLIILSYA